MARCVVCDSRFTRSRYDGPEPCDCGANFTAEAAVNHPDELKEAREAWNRANSGCTYLVEVVSDQLVHKPYANEDPEYLVLYAEEFADRIDAMEACDLMFKAGLPGMESVVVRDEDYDPIYVNTTANRRVR